MEEVIRAYLSGLTVADPQSYCNLTMIPLVSGDQTDDDYMLLDEAMESGVLVVAEVSGAGSVPELRVENNSLRKVLILDGEELVGAKQNRVVNTTLLIAANSATVIPVSCVEQGRWSYDSPGFRSERRMMSRDMRAMKAGQVHESLRRSRRHASDQGAIWSEISERAVRRDAVSPSMAMSEIYEKDRPLAEEYKKAFSPPENQIGAVFLLNGKAAGIDAFGRRDTLSRVFDKLLMSYAMDAVDGYEPDSGAPEPEDEAAALLEACRSARVESYDAPALGADGRIFSEGVIGFALAFEDRVLHFSAFSRKGPGGGRGTGSTMARYTARRRHAGER
jgi:hypothetical protein